MDESSVSLCGKELSMDKSWKELEDMIDGLTDERLIEIANEIFDYQKTGNTSEDAFVIETSELLKIANRDVEYYVLDELSKRYRKLVLLLMKNRIGDFLNSD